MSPRTFFRPQSPRCFFSCHLPVGMRLLLLLPVPGCLHFGLFIYPLFARCCYPRLFAFSASGQSLIVIGSDRPSFAFVNFRRSVWGLILPLCHIVPRFFYKCPLSSSSLYIFPARLLLKTLLNTGENIPLHMSFPQMFLFFTNRFGPHNYSCSPFKKASLPGYNPLSL